VADRLPSVDDLCLSPSWGSVNYFLFQNDSTGEQDEDIDALIDEINNQEVCCFCQRRFSLEMSFQMLLYTLSQNVKLSHAKATWLGQCVHYTYCRTHDPDSSCLSHAKATWLGQCVLHTYCRTHDPDSSCLSHAKATCLGQCVLHTYCRTHDPDSSCLSHAKATCLDQCVLHTYCRTHDRDLSKITGSVIGCEPNVFFIQCNVTQVV
jgi:hypothetical protein